MFNSRRDADRGIFAVILDDADDRRIGGGAHSAQIGKGFDPQGASTAGERREREGDNGPRIVHGAARHRLAGYHQAVSEIVNPQGVLPSRGDDSQAIPECNQ